MDGTGLVGRRHEGRILRGLVSAVRGGSSQVLVVRGEGGIGKTALLDSLTGAAGGFLAVRAAGVESEVDLPFAGLHQLCAAYLDRLGELPDRQREALGAAFRSVSGGPPEPAAVGLAALGLIRLIASAQPVICVVDDAQWLDLQSRQALEVMGRRLEDEPVALVLAVRDPLVFDGLPALTLHGLGADEAAALLGSVAPGALDGRVRERILAECRGNPSALVESTRGLSRAELVFGGATDVEATPLGQRLEREFRRLLQPLPERSRRLLLVAAAEPVGQAGLLWLAAGRLGLGADAGKAAEQTGLVSFRDSVRFRHPLVRSAVYRGAGLGERREVHRALAESTDPRRDADRRAWHRARAAVGPDEDVAAELARRVGQAATRGGVAAAAAFLDRAAALTPDPVRRVRRSLDAAQAKAQAGAFADASAVLAMAETGPQSRLEQARVAVVRARISVATRSGAEALPLLLAAARGLELLDPLLSRDAYLDALAAALSTGRLASGVGARQVAEAVRGAPPAPLAARRASDLLLDGLATLFIDGYPAAAPMLRDAVRAAGAGQASSDWLSLVTAAALGDDAVWDLLTDRHLSRVRSSGALPALPPALDARTMVELFTGDLTAAAALVEERRSVAEATRSGRSPYGEIALLAVRGRADRAEPMIRACLDDVTARGEGAGITLTQWARAVLGNGLGRYPEALAAARDAAADPGELGPPQWALGELVEAAVHSGDLAAARTALGRLTPMARAGGTDWALGVEASRRALLETGAEADASHREAIERLDRTRVAWEAARARLLYGEWLRREGRRVDARRHLRVAHEAFAVMGAEAFAGRTARELEATGETIRRRTVEAPGKLTAQEAHIARLAAEGLTNPEIGAALYISPRTVEWHLRRVYAKLGVDNRRRLRRALAGD